MLTRLTLVLTGDAIHHRKTWFSNNCRRYSYSQHQSTTKYSPVGKFIIVRKIKITGGDEYDRNTMYSFLITARVFTVLTYQSAVYST